MSCRPCSECLTGVLLAKEFDPGCVRLEATWSANQYLLMTTDGEVFALQTHYLLSQNSEFSSSNICRYLYIKKRHKKNTDSKKRTTSAACDSNKTFMAEEVGRLEVPVKKTRLSR